MSAPMCLLIAAILKISQFFKFRIDCLGTLANGVVFVITQMGWVCFRKLGLISAEDAQSTSRSYYTCLGFGWLLIMVDSLEWIQFE